MQYTQDYDERYPTGLPNSDNRRGIGWAGEIYPYVKSVQIYVCPSATNLGATTVAGASPISYALNTFVADKSMVGIEDTARNVMLSESNNKISAFLTKSDEAGSDRSPVDFGDNLAGLSSAGVGTCCDANLIQATGPFKDGFATNISADNKARHFEGANFLLADGHVKWYRGGSVTILASNAPQSAISYFRP